MHKVIYGRTLMGDSLGFHIIFALLGVGIPFLVSLAEISGIIKKDQLFTIMAKRWAFVMTVLFVTGAVSGTIISIQLSVLWPSFMAVAGKIIGLPFYLETYAFFIEAIFLGIYLYTWDRFKNKMIHWFLSIPIVLGSAASAFFITTANAFMNNPQGFVIKNGEIKNIDPVQAMFNPATPTETMHSLVSYYLTTCFCFAGVYAFLLLKEKKEKKVIHYYKKAICFLIFLSLFFAIATGITGDSSAKYLVKNEPLKLAAAEALFHTQNHAPLTIGGSIDQKNNTVRNAVTIPGMLSFLGFGDVSKTVTGLDAYSSHLWPPLWIHYMFDVMVFIGVFITLVPCMFVVCYLFKRQYMYTKILLLSIVASSFLGFVAVETGWVLTEVGRQPYAIRGMMTTEQAFTTNPSVVSFAFIFPLLYLLLSAATVWILIRHTKQRSLMKNI